MRPRVQLDTGARLLSRSVREQKERHARGMAAEHGEVDPITALMQTERERETSLSRPPLRMRFSQQRTGR